MGARSIRPSLLRDQAQSVVLLRQGAEQLMAASARMVEMAGAMALLAGELVQAFREISGDTLHADNGSGAGCEAEVTSGAPERDIVPANSQQCHTDIQLADVHPLVVSGAPEPVPIRAVVPARRVPASPARDSRRCGGAIDLTAAVSPMDARYAEMRKREAERVAQAPVPHADGKVFCSKCAPENLVPSGFGEGCIEVDCPLRGLKLRAKRKR